MSRSPDVKYHRLAQLAVSDDEDEGFDDNILFDSRLVNGTTTDNRNIFEMEELGLPRVRSSPEYYGYFSKKQRCYLAIGVIILLTVATGSGLLIPLLQTNNDHKAAQVSPLWNFQPVTDWNRTFHHSWTESSVYLLDMDKDKLDDILIGVADQPTIEGVLDRPPNMTMLEYCQSKEVDYPCGGLLLALRGTDGVQLWQASTRSVVIHQVCADLGVVGSTKMCVVTGRHSSCQAVDAFTGHVLWRVNPDLSDSWPHFVPDWNIYQALPVADLNGDSILDLVISHGGDKDKEPWDFDRKSGRLILLSGFTGDPIGSHFLELPDNKETYMPPVKYVTPTGATYILIGTGGETIQGSLLAISLPDIHRHVTGSDWLIKNDSVHYDWLKSKTRDSSGFAVIVSGQTKGVMVPPVVVDADRDGWMDILVTTFDGQVTLVNGRSLEVVWSRTFDGMETYSSPTPGFFDTDSTLDWLVHFNQGAWDKYTGSQTAILNGLDGKSMWAHHGQSYAYSSDLSIHKEAENSHLFIAKVVGLNVSSTVDSVQETVGLQRRHLGHGLEGDNSATNRNMTAQEFQTMCETVAEDMKRHFASCDQDLESLTQDIVMFDYTLRNHPVRLRQQKAERFHYQLAHQQGDFHCHPVSERQKDKINMCLVLTPTSYTGAFGDVDRDGHFDYVHLTQMLGTRHSDTHSPTQSVSKVILSKHNLHAAMTRKEFVHLEKEDADDNGFLTTLRSHVDSIRMRSLQSWCQYLGCRGDSWYHTKPGL